jgi:hypothetical protein
VPVHADVPDITTILFEEQDRVINPAGVKGLGELPIVGAGAAIASAVYHATGVRVRDLPIRLEKLLMLTLAGFAVLASKRQNMVAKILGVDPGSVAGHLVIVAVFEKPL